MATGKGAGAQLVELFDKAVKAADRVEDDEDDKAEVTRCVEAIKAMKKVSVTTALLMDTQVGKRLRKLTKHRSSHICMIAQEVLDAWKKIVAREAAAKNSSTASAAKKTRGKESLKTPGLESPGLEPRSPKSPSSIVTIEKSMKTEVKVQVKTSVTTTTSKPSAQVPPKIGNIKKTGDATRDRMRELLVEAFSKVLTEAEGEYLQEAKSRDIVQLAETVETAMFDKNVADSSSAGYKTKNPTDSNSAANKTKYRSLMFNLKDPKNPDFRRRVVIGEIEPEELLTMSVEDMGSDERRRANDEIKKKALFECERGLKAAASTDQFKCAKCKQRQCTYFQMQTRSADEPMTTFVTCVNCNNHWKFC